jgi:peptidoglycan-associated lipoprotein
LRKEKGMGKSLFSSCLALAVLALLLNGCAAKPSSAPLSHTVPAAGGPDQQASLGGAGEQQGAPGVSYEDLARAGEELRKKAREEAIAANLHDIYFDFDSYTLRDEEIRTLKNMADWLMQDQSIKLVVEGHCDERGTTEYNLALGQKRAEAAKDYLAKAGVAGSRLRTVSYGKEAPFQGGHGEEFWAKNRRVHFVAQ